MSDMRQTDIFNDYPDNAIPWKSDLNQKLIEISRRTGKDYGSYLPLDGREVIVDADLYSAAKQVDLEEIAVKTDETRDAIAELDSAVIEKDADKFTTVEAEMKKLDPDSRFETLYPALRKILESHVQFSNTWTHGRTESEMKNFVLDHSDDGRKIGEPEEVMGVSFYQIDNDSHFDLSFGFKDGRFFECIVCPDNTMKRVRYVDPASGDFVDTFNMGKEEDDYVRVGEVDVEYVAGHYAVGRYAERAETGIAVS